VDIHSFIHSFTHLVADFGSRAKHTKLCAAACREHGPVCRVQRFVVNGVGSTAPIWLNQG
jgi:hypothetical protein